MSQEGPHVACGPSLFTDDVETMCFGCFICYEKLLFLYDVQ